MSNLIVERDWYFKKLDQVNDANDFTINWRKHADQTFRDDVASAAFAFISDLCKSKATECP